MTCVDTDSSESRNGECHGSSLLHRDLLYLRLYLKAFTVFNVLETCRVYLLTIDLGIVKFITKFIKRFFKRYEIWRNGPNYSQKLLVTKAAECKLIKFFLLAIAQSNSPFFCTQFSMESNHYEMKPRFQSLSFS